MNNILDQEKKFPWMDKYLQHFEKSPIEKELEPQSEKFPWMDKYLGFLEKPKLEEEEETKPGIFGQILGVAKKIIPSITKPIGESIKAKGDVWKIIEAREREKREREAAERLEFEPEVPGIRALKPEEEELQRQVGRAEYEMATQPITKEHILKEGGMWSRDPEVNYWSEKIAPQVKWWLTAGVAGWGTRLPLFAGLMESIKQMRNIAVSLVKKSEYDPLAYRSVEELFKDLPTWARYAVRGGEEAFDLVAAAILTKKIPDAMYRKTANKFFEKAKEIGWTEEDLAPLRERLKRMNPATLSKEIGRSLKLEKYDLKAPPTRMVTAPETYAKPVAPPARLTPPAGRIVTPGGTVVPPNIPEADLTKMLYREAMVEPAGLAAKEAGLATTRINVNPLANGSVDVTIKTPKPEVTKERFKMEKPRGAPKLKTDQEIALKTMEQREGRYLPRARPEYKEPPKIKKAYPEEYIAEQNEILTKEAEILRGTKKSSEEISEFISNEFMDGERLRKITNEVIEGKRTEASATEEVRGLIEDTVRKVEPTFAEKPIPKITPSLRKIEEALKKGKELTEAQKKALGKKYEYKPAEEVKPPPAPEIEKAPERMNLVKVSITTPTGKTLELGEIPEERVSAVKEYARKHGVGGKLSVGKSYKGKWGQYMPPTEQETFVKGIIRDVKKEPKETWEAWEQVEEVDKDDYKEHYAGLAPPKEYRNIATQAVNWLLTEPQFKREGASKTGLAVKLYHPRRNTENKRTAKYIVRLNKLKLTDKEYQEATFIAARPGKFLPKTKEERAKFSPAYRTAREFFDLYEAREKELGIIEEGWPLSAIRRYENEKIHLNALLERTKDPERVKKLKGQIEELDLATNFLKKAKIQYVHIPRMWLEMFWEKNPADAPKILTPLFRQRETIDIEALAKFLLEKEAITPKDLDIRRIMAAYGHKVGHKIALAEIFKAAEEEGMIKDFDESLTRKGWTVPHVRKYPTLKGKVMHPVLSNVLQRYFGGKAGFMPPTLSKIFTYSKLMQFPNPLFLPMYDVYQSFWTGALTHLKTPAFMGRAIRSMIKQDKHYWDASYWGAFSTPYTPDFKTFDKQVKNLMTKNTFLRYAKRYVNPYHASWDAAWTGDNLIRMITYHYYTNKGFSPREAAQLTAKPHGDYAALPPQTRKTLNKIFFTPSFRIAMISAQSEMAVDLAKLIAREKRTIPMIKKIGTDGETYYIPDKNSKKYRKAMARMMAGLVGSLLIQEFVMHKLGYKTDKWGLKYVKDVEIEGEKKELVIHVANPANVFLRYYHRLTRLLEYDNPDKWERLLNAAKWDFHPLYQLAQELISNRAINFEPIYNPDDSPFNIWRDRILYSFKRIVRMTEVIPGLGEQKGSRLEAYKALVKDLGTIGVVMSWFTLPYTRNTKEQRLQYRVNGLMKIFKYYSERKPFKTDEQYDKALEKLYKKIDEIYKELEETK